MPIRKETSRGRRLNDRVIAELREVVQSGVPWRPDPFARGYSDLLYIVTGYAYFLEFLHGSDDIDAAMELWSGLREDILIQHSKQELRSQIFDHLRPWGFYALEDREGLRRLDSEPCRCPPAVESIGKLPPLRLSWFGRSRECGCAYESEEEYLSRLGLLTVEEKAAIAAEEL